MEAMKLLVLRPNFMSADSARVSLGFSGVTKALL